VAAGTGSVFPTIFELKKGLIERLRVTPTSRFALLFGPILSWVAWTLISSTVIVAVSVPFGFRIHLVGLLVFAVLLVLLLTVFAAFVMALAVLMNGEITSISGIVVGLNLPIVLLGGVLLPLALAPGWLRALAHLDPLYYAVGAGRDLAAGAVGTSAVGVAFAVLAPLAALTLWWASRVYGRAVA
jgi:ABC-2 type transport system permease protein